MLQVLALQKIVNRNGSACGIDLLDQKTLTTRLKRDGRRKTIGYARRVILATASKPKREQEEQRWEMSSKQHSLLNMKARAPASSVLQMLHAKAWTYLDWKN